MWNLICSAKDWLHVSVYGLPYIDLQHNNDDARSLNVLQLIMAFDLFVQSIMQLYRAFEEEYPLKEDRTIFEKSVADDVYFKQIRACFAAHPVNLDSSNGEKNGKRYFASWSSCEGDGDTYNVYLYSNKPGDSPVSLSFHVSKLHCYVIKRYSLLKILQVVWFDPDHQVTPERHKN